MDQMVKIETETSALLPSSVVCVVMEVKRWITCRSLQNQETLELFQSLNGLHLHRAHFDIASWQDEAEKGDCGEMKFTLLSLDEQVATEKTL